MNITFDKNLRIRQLDDLNLVLEKLSEHTLTKDIGDHKKGDKTSKWKTLGYFPNAKYVFKYIVNHKLVNDNDCRSCFDVIKRIDELEQKIEKCIS